jgi:predicted acyl esterase
LVEGSWQDKFFNASGWIENLPNLNVPFSSYLGAVHGHGGEQSYEEDVWHMNWFNDWFFQWLWDMETGILNKAKYQYAKTTFPVNGTYWTFVHDSLQVPYPQATTNMRLYFNRNSKLTTTPNNTSAKATLKNTVASGYTMQQLVWSEFKGTEFTNKFKVHSINFTSNTLTQDVEWTGIPKINIDYYSSANTFCQFNFQVWEVEPNGNSRFINRLNYTDRNYVKNSRREQNFKGQAHSHLFKAGNKIKIVLTNFDRVAQDSVFFGTAPFVLPTLNSGSHYVYLNSKSYIDIPVKSLTNSPQLVFTPDEIKNEVEIPVNFSLGQNYPNPFNPLTTINYSIREAGNVEIKVYDLLGREVAVLVNDFKQAGNYEVTLNAQNLSSGIYFYRMTSGNFTDVKRMVLVK